MGLLDNISFVLLTVLIVAQLQHQLVAYFRVSFEIEARLLHAAREAEVGKGRSDDVKCGRLSIAFQKRQYLLNFDE